MKKCLLLVLSFVFILAGCNKNKNEVYVYNWTEYIPDEVLSMFEEETGIDVVYSSYDSNEMMYSKIKLQQGSGYDVVFPSSYYVKKLADEGLLSEIDQAKLPNLKNINPELLGLNFDKDNSYSVPYMWGFSLLLYNTKYIADGSITSWNDLWNPDFAGYVMLNNDVREVFQMALMTLGYDGNSVNPAELDEAYEKLTTLVPSVRMFNSDSPKQPFINEEVRIGLIFNGEAYMAMEENADLQYSYPKEGAIAWMDCASILKGAKNVDNAHAFIDFIMRPDIAAMIVEELGYTTPNLAALALLPEELQNNEVMNPSEEIVANAQFQEDIGDAVVIYNELWERLKVEN